MKKILKIIALMLIIALLPILLAACNRSYDEAEVISAAEKLISASETLNQIYYGEGIGWLENSEKNNGIYREADPTELNRYGFKTIAELKELTKNVFSVAHSERMFEGTFSGAFLQDGSSSKARYYQKFIDSSDPIERTKPDCIMVCSEVEGLLKGDASYDLSTLAVSRVKGQVVYVTLDVSVSYEGKTQKQSLEVGLFEEEAGWRLDSPTYAVYNEFQDIYDQLQKG